MLVAALRQRILELAIQGKLVPQSTDDGNADELYQQIQQERKKLIAAGELKKEKPLPPITKEEIPFDIPESWKWVKLGALCTICTGKKDANFGSPNGDYLFFTCAKEPLRCNSYSFEGESILLAGNGDIGNISFYNGKFEAYQRTYVLQSPTSLYLLYLFYHIKYNWVKYNRGKVFGSAIPYIRLGNLGNYLVAFPPLGEQKRIVAKVGALFAELDAIEHSQERVAAIQTELNKRILELAIQGKLVPQRPEEGTAEDLYQQIQQEKKKLITAGKLKKEKPLPPISEDEIPFDIPESWKWVHMGDVFAHNTGKAQNSTAETRNGILRKFITTSNVYWNRFDFSKVKEMLFTEKEIEKCSVQKGDLLVCEGGDCGRAAIWQDDESMCIQNHIHRLRPYVGVDIMFFYYVFLLLKQKGHINGKGVGIKGLSSNTLHKLPCPLPPLKEQRRIVEKMDEIPPIIC